MTGQYFFLLSLGNIEYLRTKNREGLGKKYCLSYPLQEDFTWAKFWEYFALITREKLFLPEHMTTPTQTRKQDRASSSLTNLPNLAIYRIAEHLAPNAVRNLRQGGDRRIRDITQPLARTLLASNDYQARKKRMAMRVARFERRFTRSFAASTQKDQKTFDTMIRTFETLTKMWVKVVRSKVSYSSGTHPLQRNRPERGSRTSPAFSLYVSDVQKALPAGVKVVEIRSWNSTTTLETRVELQFPGVRRFAECRLSNRIREGRYTVSFAPPNYEGVSIVPIVSGFTTRTRILKAAFLNLFGVADESRNVDQIYRHDEKEWHKRVPDRALRYIIYTHKKLRERGYKVSSIWKSLRIFLLPLLK
jgi:hypothetical protein